MTLTVTLSKVQLIHVRAYTIQKVRKNSGIGLNQVTGNREGDEVGTRVKDW